MKKILKQKIITVGGGSGSYCVLSGLKKYNIDLSCVVNMFDDGGSTGRLRSSYKVLPPGDLRQCIIALLKDKNNLKDKILNYRFVEGDLKGHSFGNIFITTLQLIHNDFNKVLDSINKIFDLKGRILPITFSFADLCAVSEEGTVIKGQRNISLHSSNKKFIIKNLFISPEVKINPAVVSGILSADKIIICPGDLFASITPHFLIKDFVEAIIASKAKLIYISNIVNKLDQTRNYKVQDFVKYIESFLSGKKINTVIYNTGTITDDVLFQGERLKDLIVQYDKRLDFGGRNFIGQNLIGEIYQQKIGDEIIRSPIRHDKDNLAKIIFDL